jgi:hypothetical protein
MVTVRRFVVDCLDDQADTLILTEAQILDRLQNPLGVHGFGDVRRDRPFRRRTTGQVEMQHAIGLAPKGRVLVVPPQRCVRIQCRTAHLQP